MKQEEFEFFGSEKVRTTTMKQGDIFSISRKLLAGENDKLAIGTYLKIDCCGQLMQTEDKSKADVVITKKEVEFYTLKETLAILFKFLFRVRKLDAYKIMVLKDSEPR